MSSDLRVGRGGEPSPETVTITFDGAPVTTRRGESLAAALTAAGLQEFRSTPNDSKRGLFCGMGVCQDCLVEVDGRANRRACMTTVTGPLSVRSGRRPSLASATGEPDRAKPKPRKSKPDILVVGAGAGGLFAALAARQAGADVVVLDERAAPGGQYFKQPAAIYAVPGTPGEDRQFESGRSLIEQCRHAGVSIVSGAEVWGAFAPIQIAALTPDGAVTYQPKRLIVATGAYERGLPVPGWTLPGVMTTGAAQTLLRSYRTLPGKRILMAGNGPLNLQVGLELARSGADVVGVAEASPMPMSRSVDLMKMAFSAPGLFLQGLSYVAGLRRRGIAVHRGRFLLRVDKAPDGLRATIGAWRDGKTVPTAEFLVDTVCMGYGFMPSNEILRLLGVRHDYDSARGHLKTRRKPNCETEVAGLYAVGDCCGLGGARAAVEEGTIAGLDAVASLGVAAPDHDRRTASARARRDRQARFQSALWSFYAAPLLTTELCEDDTLVCRCEEVSHGLLRDTLAGQPEDIGSIKRCTRAGMGRCQGRYCAPNIAAMIANHSGRALEERSFFAPRPPIKPVRIGDIAETLLDSSEPEAAE